jgi:DNA-binding IclR family transcriptional regulator
MNTIITTFEDKMAGGRPTKYNAKMLERAQHYLHNFKEYGDVVPIIEGLALELGVTTDTLRNWSEAHPEFLDTFNAVKTSQARNLLNGGLNNTHNTAITKLMLANHNYTEKQEVKSTNTTTNIIVQNADDAKALGDLDDVE